MPRDLHKRLRGGVELDDGPVKVDSFRVVDTHAGQSVVEVVLHEGRKHIVRRLLAEVGLPVSRLTRTAVGPIELRAMRSGTIRKLSRQELGTLSELVGCCSRPRVRTALRGTGGARSLDSIEGPGDPGAGAGQRTNEECAWPSEPSGARRRSTPTTGSRCSRRPASW